LRPERKTLNYPGTHFPESTAQTEDQRKKTGKMRKMRVKFLKETDPTHASSGLQVTDEEEYRLGISQQGGAADREELS
jgi:hypothetical protein